MKSHITLIENEGATTETRLMVSSGPSTSPKTSRWLPLQEKPDQELDESPHNGTLESHHLEIIPLSELSVNQTKKQLSNKKNIDLRYD